jgi:hypothetical protein
LLFRTIDSRKSFEAIRLIYINKFNITYIVHYKFVSQLETSITCLCGWSLAKFTDNSAIIFFAPIPDRTLNLPAYLPERSGSLCLNSVGLFLRGGDVRLSPPGASWDGARGSGVHARSGLPMDNGPEAVQMEGDS